MTKFKSPILYAFTVSLWLAVPAFGLRVITLSPQSTELFWQLGKASDLIAGSSALRTDGPRLQSVGPLFMPSIEKLARFAPDWVVSDSFFTSPTFLEGVSTLAISKLSLQISDLPSLLSESRRALRLIYHDEKNAELDKVALCIRQLPSPQSTFRYLAFTWFDPPILFGDTAFLSDLIRRAGGKAPELPGITSQYPQVSQEWVISQHVDVIFYLQEGNQPEVHQVEAIAKRWWKTKPPVVVALPSEKFAITTFTPLKYWSTLRPTHELKTPEACENL